MVEIYISVKADTHITTNVHLVSKLGLQVSTTNTTVKTSKQAKEFIAFLKQAKISETFAAGQTGICFCCMIQAGTYK
jgi:hypothetical protein